MNTERRSLDGRRATDRWTNWVRQVTYLLLGIGSVLASWSDIRGRLDRLEERVLEMETRITSLERRIDLQEIRNHNP